MTSVVLKDPSPEFREILTYFLSRTSDFSLDSHDVKPLSELSPPKIVIVEPWGQQNLTGGFNFYEKPEQALEALDKTIAQQYGPASGLVVVTSITPESIAPVNGRALLRRVPIFDKESIALFDLTQELETISQVRAGFFNRVAHETSNAVQVLSHWLFLANDALTRDNLVGAHTYVSELLPLIERYRSELSQTDPRRADAEFILFPMLESEVVVPLIQDLSKIPQAKRIPAEYLDRQARATFVLKTIENRLERFAAPLLKTELASLPNEGVKELVTQLTSMASEMAQDIRLLKKAWPQRV